jgi:serine/threonine-protein phosphatase 6 regulatory subunit 3
MGHLTLISEDVIGALDHFPPDLRLVILQYAPGMAWDEYVTGRYSETKQKDSCLLGGGKPIVTSSISRAGARWRVDEEDNSPLSGGIPGTSANLNGANEMRGDFRRATSVRPMRENSADFGNALMEEQDNSDAHGSQVLLVSRVVLFFSDS